jgi:Flp pilus assembly protein TadG
MKARALLARFRRSAHGIAAVEFALVLPFLATIALLLPDLSQAAAGVIDMQGAARASIQYAMTGGTDLTEARTLGLGAWSNQPADASFSATESCTCAGAGATCGQPCANGSSPQEYFNVTASGHVGGSFIGFENSVARSVRIQ